MDWKGIVKSVAPALGTALGGPLAGTAVKEIAGKWLGNENATERDIEQAVKNASPEQLAELKRIDAEYNTRMRELDIDVFKTEVADRQDARQMAITIMWPQITLTCLFVSGYFSLIYILLLSDVSLDSNMQTLLTALVSIMTAGMQQVLSFWFGSSKGSQDKDRTIQQVQTRRL